MRSSLAIPLILVLCACCASLDEEQGLAVEVALSAPSSPELVDGVRTLQNDLGYRVRITKAYLATGSVELRPCHDDDDHHHEGDDDHHGGDDHGGDDHGHDDRHTGLDLRRIGRGLLDLVVARAHAHAPGSPAKLGIPVVESLLASAGTRIDVGTMRPPPGHYCRIRYTAFAADADAVGLPADASMVGRTLRIEGSWSRNGSEETPFVVDSALSFKVDLDFPELSLDTEGTSFAALTIGKSLNRWFDGVDFESDDAEDIEDTVFDNMPETFRASRP